MIIKKKSVFYLFGVSVIFVVRTISWNVLHFKPCLTSNTNAAQFECSLNQTFRNDILIGLRLIC